ncbi:hypothetical protein T484DRAFT_1831844 [Baffinella frigidus]|nr:hypothetical protein T484DRAFT_1831844 [Cryptophyta sp. CCMP2293]
MSLRVSARLEEEVQKRFSMAGVHLVNARISHLCYAREAMLQRQQAGAIIGARRQIVAGACGIVETALNDLKDRNVVELSEDRKAALASNLLIVLCGEGRAQPPHPNND